MQRFRNDEPLFRNQSSKKTMSLKLFHCHVFAAALPVALLCISAVAFAGEVTPLFELSKVDTSKLSTSHATATAKGRALCVRSVDPGVQGTVQFDIPEAMRDLSKRGFVEISLENTGDKPMRFTFWVLSGNGWGGASTWSTQPKMFQDRMPDQPKSPGTEVLAAKDRRTFQIDLHACHAVFRATLDKHPQK
jgi:hypothetical protein